ncbi:MAG: O-antigen ligase family protein [Nitrospira sp.]
MEPQIDMGETAAVSRKPVRKWLLPQKPDAATFSFPMVMYLVYLGMEYMRPPNPLGIPLVISIVLFGVWVAQSNKIWAPQFYCFFALLAVIAVMGPFAENNYNVFMWARNMGIMFICIVIPLVHVVSNERRFAVFIAGIAIVMVYLGLYAITHGGRGPGGHVGDENDAALALNSFIPLVFLSMFLAKSVLQRVLYGLALGIMVLGVAATMSRGGFIGLVAALGYCFFLTPNKGKTLALGFVMLLILIPLAPEKYWDEIASIGTEASNEDPRLGTGALRKEYWKAAREMFKANPVFGVGAGNFRWNLGKYQTQDQFERLGRSLEGTECHSVYFATLAELGAAGFGLFLATLWYNVRDLSGMLKAKNPLASDQQKVGLSPQLARVKAFSLHSTVRSKRSQPAAAEDLAGIDPIEQSRLTLYAHGLRGGLLGFLVSGVFLSAFGYPPFWLLTGLIIALKMISRPQSESRPLGAF